MAGPTRQNQQSFETSIAEADTLLVGDGETPPNPEAAFQHYMAAVEAGSGAAAVRAATLTAIGIGQPANWPEALDLLLRGAELDDRPARRQLALIAGRTEERLKSGEVSGASIWRGVRADIDIEAVLTPPPIAWVSSGPRVGVVKGLVSPDIAEWLIRRASNALEPGRVNDAGAGGIREHAMRTAMTAAFPVLRRDMVMAFVQERAARATGLAVAQHEPPNVISYEPGQQFEEHFDFVEPLSPHFQDELGVLGQRVATCVTYLNDGFTGAETYFPLANLKLRGRVGDCIVFVNVLPDGQPDRRTLHAGLPPAAGRKWILSQWMRDRVQPLV